MADAQEDDAENDGGHEHVRKNETEGTRVLDRLPPAAASLQLMATSAASASVIRVLLGAVPALLTVLFAGLITLLALLMGEDRRQYALDVADCFIKFAAVLVGASQPSPTTRRSSRKSRVAPRSKTPERQPSRRTG